MFLIGSEMAGASRLNLGVLIEDMCENILAKEFFGSVNIHQDQVSGRWTTGASSRP